MDLIDFYFLPMQRYVIISCQALVIHIELTFFSYILAKSSFLKIKM